MFIVFLVLFAGGLYLFGLAFALTDPWNTIVFVSGLLAVSLALGLLVHGPGRAKSEAHNS